MPYPNSPFDDNFNPNWLTKVTDDETSVKEIQIQIKDAIRWLCEIPRITSYRVNTLKYNTQEVCKLIREQVDKVLSNGGSIRVEEHQALKEVITISDWPSKSYFERHDNEVIVDVVCAAAVLRGAHIYVPGVLALSTEAKFNEIVSIYADLEKKCKQGLHQPYNFPKVFLGNGIVKVTRHDLFVKKEKSGVAIEVLETIGNCPPLGDSFLPKDSALLQNLPSIICVHVLNPQPKSVVLDMCASPGNKMTHIAALMRNQGKLIAIDKTPNKVKQLRLTCNQFGAEVEIMEADSTKISFDYQFDKILLDAPCSALGKRPQLANNITEKVLRSYVPLQRKLFENAVRLLKPNGVLVYSTCTITLAENEGIVAWALKKFSNIKLIHAHPLYGKSGFPCGDFKDEELQKVQRFGPNQKIDSVGFFIAKFVKN